MKNKNVSDYKIVNVFIFIFTFSIRFYFPLNAAV
jgi:hypothetical protein